MSYTQDSKKLFSLLSDRLFNSLKPGEEASTNLSGEETTYCRFNAGKIRQNTHVVQTEFKMMLKKGSQVMNLAWQMPYDEKKSCQVLDQNLNWLREQMKDLPSYEHPPEIVNRGQSEYDSVGRLPNHDQIFSEIPRSVTGLDFCGLLASGPQIYANQNSAGQKHWFSRESFFVDYSLYAGDRAVKDGFAGAEWSSEELQNQIQESANRLALMKKPVVSLKPGKYRVYLEPAAVDEMMGFLSYSAFGQRLFQTGGSFLMALGRGEKSLNSMIHIKENFDLAVSPRFNEFGELTPTQVPLIENGKLVQWLTCTRSAQEFGVPNNLASESENPRSLEIGTGSLRKNDILKELGTGLYLGNLHYINGSDLTTARMTGMTRYACFWVENGEIVGPIENLRFDESLYEAWGPKLMSVTDFSKIIPSVLTYGARALGGHKLPGMLIDHFSFTL